VIRECRGFNCKLAESFEKGPVLGLDMARGNFWELLRFDVRNWFLRQLWGIFRGMSFYAGLLICLSAAAFASANVE
jgi:hypothetical protein